LYATDEAVAVVVDTWAVEGRVTSAMAAAAQPAVASRRRIIFSAPVFESVGSRALKDSKSTGFYER
jgi:hypothetical protein